MVITRSQATTTLPSRGEAPALTRPTAAAVATAVARPVTVAERRRDATAPLSVLPAAATVTDRPTVAKAAGLTPGQLASAVVVLAKVTARRRAATALLSVPPAAATVTDRPTVVLATAARGEQYDAEMNRLFGQHSSHPSRAVRLSSAPRTTPLFTRLA